MTRRNITRPAIAVRAPSFRQLGLVLISELLVQVSRQRLTPKVVAIDLALGPARRPSSPDGFAAHLVRLVRRSYLSF